ncbi:MAG: hypothetical protein R3B07_04350 [Polyangiaceae bacterium]
MLRRTLVVAVFVSGVACTRQKPEQCANAIVQQPSSPASASLASIPPVKVTHRVVLSEETDFDGYGSRKMKGKLGPLEVEWEDSSHRGLHTSSGSTLFLYLPGCKQEGKSQKIDVSVDEVALYRVGDQLVISTGRMDRLKAFKIVPPLAAASLP